MLLVRVYAGIATGHEWATKKPMELAATLQLIPDENGEVFFSVNEILKSYIETRNNLLLGTLPNNIDFWNNFYIEYAESYDDADGYALGTYTSAFTSDESNFVGYSVNAKLEFKNLQSGYMSDYLMNHTTAKFLTLFVIPVLFGCSDDAPECYQDISFIKESSEDYILSKQFYSNGVAGDLEQDTISGDAGIYRVQIPANCNYDSVDLSLISGSTITNITSDQIDAGGQFGTGTDWAADGGQSVILVVPNLAAGQSKRKAISYSATPQTLTFSVNWSYVLQSGFLASNTISVSLLRSDGSIIGVDGIDTHSISLSASSGTANFNLTSLEEVFYIGFRYDALAGGGGGGTGKATVNSFSVTTQGGMVISESKTFKIDCGCSAQELRLTWLNNLGGFDYWNFTARKDHIIEIRETIETKKNILPQWPKSYSTNADTIRRQTARVSNKAYTVRSQYITQSEADALAYIKSSVLVQIINSRQNRRTVIVDSDSFVIYPDGADLYSIAFNVSFTDDIPSQTV